jgi:tRNA pseudouridine38-40 synthase
LAVVIKLRLALEYDGARFDGWARQPVRPTVEGAVRDALDSVFPHWDDLAVAGRTDAGVHASGQVVSVSVEGGPPAEHAAEALNRRLPPDIAFRSSTEAVSEFHARFSAQARAYRYRVLNSRSRSALERRVLWHPRALDVRQLQSAAATIVGPHDFRAFTPTETEHSVFQRSVLAASWAGEAGGLLTFSIVADGFLRHMVRTLVGTMLEQEPAQILELLAGAPRERAGRTVLPDGLCLVGVAYTAHEVDELRRRNCGG